MRLKKNNFWRIILMIIVLQLFPAVSFAQNKIKIEGNENLVPFQAALILDKGVMPYKEIDKIYDTFFRAYVELKPEMVANLYTENAAYLQPNADIITGRDAILENFTSFFNSVKNGGRNITISFQILQRKVEKKIAYDVGIYTIISYKDGKKLGESKGKFVVVAVKDNDGKWRFQVDGFSGLKPQDKN